MSAAQSPFLRRPIPVVGESFYGFERRFAACTRFKLLSAFRVATGIAEMGPRSAPSKFARLAMLAGVDVEAIAHMRWGSLLERRHVPFLGSTIRETHLRSEELRFCPQCLAEDGPPEQRIHLQAWQVLQVAACPRHGTLLLERCDACGEPLEHRRSTEAWACACGREMTEMEASKAPEGAISIARAIMQRLETDPDARGFDDEASDRLPEAFEALPLEDLLMVVSKIGMLATSPASEDSPIQAEEKILAKLLIDPAIGVEDAARLMDVAHHIIMGWPHAMDAVFADIIDRNPDPATDHPLRAMFATRTGYRLLSLIKSTDGTRIPIIDDALGDWLLRERNVYIDGRRRIKSGTEDDLAIDIADAMRRLEGRVINPGGISAWAGAGAVEVKNKKVKLASVNRTVQALADLECAVFDDAMSVEEWSTHVPYTRNYRRSDAIRDVLSGRIRVQRETDGGRTGLASLRICRQDFHSRIREAMEMSGSKRGEKRVGPKMTDAERKAWHLDRRIARARRIDGFCQPGRLVALLAELWPSVQIPDVTAQEGIRCQYNVTRYRGRDCPKRLYSIVDAVEFMEARQASMA